MLGGKRRQPPRLRSGMFGVSNRTIRGFGLRHLMHRTFSRHASLLGLPVSLHSFRRGDFSANPRLVLEL